MTQLVTTGGEIELRIESLAYGGRGIARHQGLVVFVEGAFPGDRVRARIERVRRRHAEARAIAIVEPGPDRVVPPCAHYPECGGCRLQDLAYPAQAELKERQVRDALVRIGRVAEPPLEPIVPAVSPYAYRNKLEYSFTDTPDGAAPGLHRAGRFDEVLPIARCWLTGDRGNAIRDAVRAWARGERLAAFDVVTRRGYLRNLVVRESSTGEALVLLVTAPGDLPGRERLVEALRRVPEVTSIHWAPTAHSDLAHLTTTLLYGAATIEERILGLRFRVGPTTFMQTNTAMVERLYGLALDAAGLAGEEIVFDLYCGIGTISLALARRARGVFGLELDEVSVGRARENAELNGIDNVSFLAGDVGKTLDRLLRVAGEGPGVVVVDPPRSGIAPKALARIGALAAPRLVYVSCNPTTLAGDARTLIERFGYRLVRARPLDMFPQTPHVETVALLER
ncbi:MAG: 23S rRNA (uracil-5-)-methyltransferase RumA [Chloroflexi bacterium 13_1_40CM_4_68_4]|nr:MAG: 23S rRNA (uracil-5-)-methyltransferase RumA [Chloroflexi bacterium 13_1_40CM_4_68_4]